MIFFSTILLFWLIKGFSGLHPLGIMHGVTSDREGGMLLSDRSEDGPDILMAVEASESSFY